jgi:hypothetical protein
MKLEVGTPAWEDIVAVFVNGKRIAYPVECDLDQGYCIGLVPKVYAQPIPADGLDHVAMEAQGETELEWEEKRFEGRVSVSFRRPATP